jgi:16S rRNA (cytosine967-C5)-methyltransferase
VSSGSQGARLRATAAEIVDAVVGGGRSLDAALAAHENRIRKEDRALLRMLCYGALRHHWQLGDWLDRLLERPIKRRDGTVRALLVLGLFQLSATRIPDHAVVSATVEATRMLGRPGLAGLVNAVLRRARRDRIFDVAPSNDEARWNHPRWLIDTVRADWPDAWAEILTANNERAPMWLRVNRARGTVESYRERLAEAGIAAGTQSGLPQALRLDEPVAVEQLPGFATGDVSVQDGAAQIAAPWLLRDVEGRVLDACAAPGGKSGHLLELAGDRIDLTCIDNDEARLAGVGANLDRLGFAATQLVADASSPGTWWDGRAYSAILLDAPCSASGVIRRHPDIKLNRRATDIEQFSRRQSAMLEALWPLLAPGGRLLYVTCSVLAAENDRVVGRFLDTATDAEEDDVLQDNNIRDLMRDKACGHQILPGVADLDGFYYAGLVKVS